MKPKSPIVSVLRAARAALETRLGRALFRAAVCLAFIALGFVSVLRAEFPEKLYVPHPHYTSPTQMGEDRDSQAKWRSSEFRGFRSIAWGVIMEGKDPYTNLFDPQTGRVHVRAYPPFFAIAFFPFALPWSLPGSGSALFFITGFAFALLSAWCCAGWAGRGQKCFGLFALLFILLAPLAFDVMARCESDMLILFPIALAFLWLVRGQKPFSAGALLGFAASFKVLPGLFGLCLLFSRRWRALGGMVCAGILCSVLLPALIYGPGRSWALDVSWYRVVVAPYNTGRVQTFITDPYRPSNQSLSAGLNRLLRPLPYPADRPNPNVNLVSLSPAAVNLLVKALHAAVALALLLLWLLCSPRQTAGPPLSAAEGAPFPDSGGEQSREAAARGNVKGRSASCTLHSALRIPHSAFCIQKRCVAPPSSRAAAFLIAAVAPGILLLSDVSLTSHHVLLLLPLAALLVSILALDDPPAKRWAWVFVIYLAAILGVAIAPVKPYTPLLPATVVLLIACFALSVPPILHSSFALPSSRRLQYRHETSRAARDG